MIEWLFALVLLCQLLLHTSKRGGGLTSAGSQRHVSQARWETLQVFSVFTCNINRFRTFLTQFVGKRSDHRIEVSQDLSDTCATLRMSYYKRAAVQAQFSNSNRNITRTGKGMVNPLSTEARVVDQVSLWRLIFLVFKKLMFDSIQVLYCNRPEHYLANRTIMMGLFGAGCRWDNLKHKLLADFQVLNLAPPQSYVYTPPNKLEMWVLHWFKL